MEEVGRGERGEGGMNDQTATSIRAEGEIRVEGERKRGGGSGGGAV